MPKPSQRRENPSIWVWLKWVSTSMGFIAMSSINLRSC